MDASFPEVRFGGVYGTTNLVLGDQAEALVAKICESGEKYEKILKEALLSQGVDADSWEFNLGQPKRRQRFVINFPKFRFSFADYLIEGRLSVTVCREWRRSKVWVRLTCLEAQGQEASTLAVTALHSFFDEALELAEKIERRAAKTYLEQGRSQGFDVIEDRLHELRIRTFNSGDDSSRRLYEDLEKNLSLRNALAEKNYREELVDFFQVALRSQEVSTAQILDDLTNGRLEFFRYFNENDQKHRTLVTANTSSKITDLCAYGFSPATHPFQYSTSHRAGVGLARDYGVQF